MLNSKAFTLVELLVVVVIIGFLAATTLPTYQLNSAKARVSTVTSILGDLMQQVMITYSATGQVPSSLLGISGDGSNGGYGVFVVSNLTTHLHYDNGSTWSNKGALIQLDISNNIGKAIPGYVQSSSGSNGTFNAVSMAFYEDDTGTLRVYCGRWDSSSNVFLPLEYLPSGCNTDNFIHSVSGL
jgi:prepilin-type N-terminal cleavage/methylation domain-containing protein